jgi:hypothetical protein
VGGIPSFWLTIFKNVDMLSEMVQVSIEHACAGPGVGGWDSQLLTHHLQECAHALRNGSGQY